MITANNWNYCYYSAKEHKSFISLAASPEDTENLFYCVTLTDINEHELEQFEFTDLKAACAFINNNYQAWDFKDLTVKDGEKTGSCSSCQAH
jgi:hypothetical protein